MKKPATIKYKDLKYVINQYQEFYVNDDLVKDHLIQEIKFPVVIMDTEFFNASHDVDHLSKKLYSDDEPDLIYVICYSIAQNYNDLANRKNKKSITTLYVRRKYNQKKFDFKKEMDRMLTTFINTCLSKKINTLVFAGQSNDKKILTNWINKHSSLLTNKETQLFRREKDNGKFRINTFDIYQTLENGFSFSDYNSSGDVFYNPKNLKQGTIGNQTIQIPSLKLFFEYFNNFYPDTFEEESGIYQLCCDSLKFYTQDTFESQSQFDYLNEKIKEVKKHCRNDVLKLLYIINFMYDFGVLRKTKLKIE